MSPLIIFLHAARPSIEISGEEKGTCDEYVDFCWLFVWVGKGEEGKESEVPEGLGRMAHERVHQPGRSELVTGRPVRRCEAAFGRCLGEEPRSGGENVSGVPSAARNNTSSPEHGSTTVASI